MKEKITQQYSCYHKMLVLMALNHLSKQRRQLFFFELIGLMCTKLYPSSRPRLPGPSNYHQSIKCLNTQEKQYGATRTN